MSIQRIWIALLAAILTLVVAATTASTGGAVANPGVSELDEGFSWG